MNSDHTTDHVIIGGPHDGRRVQLVNYPPVDHLQLVVEEDLSVENANANKPVRSHIYYRERICYNNFIYYVYVDAAEKHNLVGKLLRGYKKP